jgi:fatty-acyl-CoA synthase
MNQGIGLWLSRRAEINPHWPALAFEDCSWTYAEWNADVQQARHALREAGVNAGDRVATLTLNVPEFLTLAFACWQSGVIFVPLNFRLSAPELAFMLCDAGVHTLLAGQDFTAVVDSIRGEVPVRRYVSLEPAEGWMSWKDFVSRMPESGWAHAVREDEIAIIMYTSGTTGRQKGAMLTHGNIFWNNVNAMHCFALGDEEQTLVCAPLFHIGGLNVTALNTLQRGGTVHLIRSFDPKVVLDAIETRRITSMFGVPAMFLFMSQMPDFAERDLSSMRLIICGGAPVPEPLIELYGSRGIPFVQGYGLTETSPFCTLLPSRDLKRKIGSAGLPPMYTEVRIVDDHNRPAAPGERGEIVARGPNVMKGYWNRPEATAEAIDAEGWFHTGDIGACDEEGYFFILDRKKDMVITGGENVYPAEVEAVLHQMPGVADCGVVGLSDERWGERVVAVVVRAPGAALTPADVVAFAEGKLARYKIPKQVEFVDALPRNPQGKILKRVLREQFASPVAAPSPRYSTGRSS